MIELWWIGESEANAAMVDTVRLRVACALGRPVSVHDGGGRPRDTWDPRRDQHSATRILEWLVEEGPKGRKLLGITDVDLFIPILTFVFGEAQLGGATALVSTARMVDLAARVDPKVVHERLAKEAIHELGHTFGLVHCRARRCAMSRAGSLREVDLKSGSLCQDCAASLGRRERGAS